MTAISHRGSSQQRSVQLVMLCTVLCSLKFPAFIPDFKETFCAISLIPHFPPSFCRLLFFLVFIFVSFSPFLSSFLFSRCPSLFGKSSFWTVSFEATMSVDRAIIFPVKGNSRETWIQYSWYSVVGNHALHARATYRLISYLLADKKLICRLYADFQN